MKIVDLNDKLKVNKNCFYNVILVNGPWGIGKTHYIKEALKKEEHIYLSAFGVEELDDLKYGLYYELDKKGAKILKKLSELYGNNIGIGPISIPIPNIKIDLEESIKEELKDSNLIIVIDDFERKSNYIEIKELLGFAESLSQVKGVKIIIIANDEKLEDKDKTIFNDFKEKVVKRIYNIDAISEVSINDIIEEKYNKNIFEKYLKLNEYKKLTNDFFYSHNINNLRTLQKAILFSNEVLSNIGDLMEKDDIIELTKVCYAVVIEENDKIYLTLEENKILEKEDYISEMYKQEDYCILKHYFSEGIFYSSRVDLIRPVINIYNTVDEQKSYENIQDYFKLKNSPITQNKALFYCSREQIEKRLNDFIEKEIKNKSNKDIITWFKELNQLYPWIEKLNLGCKISDDEIKDAMDMYIKEIDFTQKLYDIINHHLFFEIESANMKELYKVMKSKIANHYINEKIKELEMKISSGSYENELLDNIFITINNSQLVEKDIRKNLLEKIYSKNYFIPNLNSEIDESIWSFAHKIWSDVHSYEIEDKKLFSKCVSRILKNANEIGRYRINSLNEQYGIGDVQEEEKI